MHSSDHSISFLQLSDAHLDARLGFRELGFDSSQRNQRNNEALESVLRLLNLVSERKLDAVLICGNLWQAESVTPVTVARLAEAFAAVDPVPVIICPGRADPLTAESFFNSRVMAAHGLRGWTSNVQVLRSAGLWQAGSAKIWIDSAALPSVACSMSDDMRLADYAAFGGRDSFSELRDEDGRLVASAAGSLVVRSHKHVEPRSASIVSLKHDGIAQYEASIERVASDTRRVVVVSVSVNGLKSHNVLDQIRKMVESSPARPGVDIVHVKLTGLHLRDLPFEVDVGALQEDYFHVIIEDNSRSDYHLDSSDIRSTEGRFIKALQDMKHHAEVKGGFLSSTEYGTGLTAKVIEDALYYGLDALNQKKVWLKNVD